MKLEETGMPRGNHWPLPLPCHMAVPESNSGQSGDKQETYLCTIQVPKSYKGEHCQFLSVYSNLTSQAYEILARKSLIKVFCEPKLKWVLLYFISQIKKVFYQPKLISVLPYLSGTLPLPTLHRFYYYKVMNNGDLPEF